MEASSASVAADERVPLDNYDPAPMIEIVDYGPTWPAVFERERAPIADALGELAAAIEHTGSTAVPGTADRRCCDAGLHVVVHVIR